MDELGEALAKKLLKNKIIRISKEQPNRSKDSEKLETPYCDMNFTKITTDHKLQEEICRIYAQKIKKEIYDKEGFEHLYGIPEVGRFIVQEISRLLQSHEDFKDMYKKTKTIASYKFEKSMANPEIIRKVDGDAIAIDDCIISGESLIRYCKTYNKEVSPGRIVGVIVGIDAGMYHNKSNSVVEHLQKELKTKVHAITTLDDIVRNFTEVPIENEGQTRIPIKTADAEAYIAFRTEYLDRFGKTYETKKD